MCLFVNSLPRPQCCSRDIEDGLGVADGWQPKSSHHSIWQGKPACCEFHTSASVCVCRHIIHHDETRCGGQHLVFKIARFLDSREEDRDHALEASPLRRTTLQKYSAGQIIGKWVFAKVFAESPSSSKSRGYSKYELEEEKRTSEFKLSLVFLGCATTYHKTTRQASQVETIHIQACASPSLVSPTQRPKEPATYVIDNNHVV